ncbi:MAG: hypothetical protein ACRESZ_19050 [Methylococcales bacterium]
MTTPENNLGLALEPDAATLEAAITFDSRESTQTSHAAYLEIVPAGPAGACRSIDRSCSGAPFATRQRFGSRPVPAPCGGRNVTPAELSGLGLRVHQSLPPDAVYNPLQREFESAIPLRERLVRADRISFHHGTGPRRFK